VAALEAALALRTLAGELVTVELVAPEPRFWYRPLAVAEPFRLAGARHFELGALATAAGATLTLAAADSVDSVARIVHTTPAGQVSYDRLLIACGAVPRPAIPGAALFRGPADTPVVDTLLADLAAGHVVRTTFAVPAGAVWSLPAYELALMTSAWCESRGLAWSRVSIATPEERPLGLFGADASRAVASLLEERGIDVHTGSAPAAVRGDDLILDDGRYVPADRVVALPRLRGQPIDGLPVDEDSFVAVDAHGRVIELDDVYAAGDITTFPVKQGGLAAQQADAAAQAIAASVGADVTPQPFRPVLRGLLLTGAAPRYLRQELAGGADQPTAVSPEALWWPPAKISTRYLAPFLGELAGAEYDADLDEDQEGGIPVQLELKLG
jgi:sulfide:quinone oxidoreductase